MRADAPRFALVAFPAETVTGTPTIMRIPEDVLPLARARQWIVLGVDSDVLAEPIHVFNPPKLADPDDA